MCAVIAGLIVSIDALFIGISFGTNKRCRFWHVVVINMFLLALCFVGYIIGVFVLSNLEFDFDIIIGTLFILLGLWVIASCFIFEKRKEKKGSKSNSSSLVITGLLMSVEAMLITLGLTLTLDYTTVLIPITVGLAHFIYCTVTFFLAKYFRRLSPIVGHVISGVALIIYGVMALVI